jgi:predicted transcriptional regulator
VVAIGETVRGFGELESEIMDFVWSADGPVLVREVRDAINGRRQRSIAYTSVQTVMEILHHKGWLARARDGRAYRYTAVHSREDYAASLIDQVFESGADRTVTLVKLVEQMDPAEAEELRAALAAAKSGGAS